MLVASATETQRFFLWLAPSMVTVGFSGVVFEAWSGNYVPIPLWIVSPVMVLVAWWSFLRIPRRVTVDDRALVFDVPGRSFVMTIADITQINARKWNGGCVTVSARRKQIFLPRGMSNLRAVSAAVLERNPAIRLIGQLPETP